MEVIEGKQTGKLDAGQHLRIMGWYLLSGRDPPFAFGQGRHVRPALWPKGSGSHLPHRYPTGVLV